jgi:hypothetical protein
MSNEVYANGMEIACKAADGKTVAALPDVCLSPPSPPAGPVPIPYPNTAYASDTTAGSKTVYMCGKEVMLKDKSYFKQSTGDEAATKSLGMGVVTHQIQGKVNFSSWSMDVKIEDENAVRHLDLTMHNEMSLPANTPPWPYLANMSLADQAKCAADKDREEKACGYDSATRKYNKTVQQACDDADCQKARKCMLVPYEKYSSDTKKMESTCCPGQSGHHLLEDHGFCSPRGKPIPKFQGTGYSIGKAPCVCASSPNTNWEAEHGDLHSVQGVKENYAIMTAGSRNPPRPADEAWTYGEARQAGVDAHAATFKAAPTCNDACIAAQLDAYYKDELHVNDSDGLRTKKYGFGSDPDQKARGVQMIKELAEKRIGDIVGGPFPLG